MAEKREILETAKFAAKWWADRIVGDQPAVFVSPDLQDSLDELKEMDYDAWQFMKEHVEEGIKQTQDKLKARYVDQDTKEKFQVILEHLIMEDLDKGLESYLFADADGVSGTLARAAAYACIDIGNDGVFAYFIPTDMFVGKEKVEARFFEKSYFHVIYDLNFEMLSKEDFKGSTQTNAQELKREKV